MLSKKISLLSIYVVLILSVSFFACKKDGGTVVTDMYAKAMIVHANINAPAIDFFIDGSKINKDSLVYGVNTPYTDVKLTQGTKTQFKIGLTKLGTFLLNDSSTLTENTGITYYVALDTLSKTPLILVVDGTWNTARKMLRLSRNLHSVPRICFTPVRPSRFRVRKQPHPNCYSTIEAIHQTLELLGPSQGFDILTGRQSRLLRVLRQTW